MKILGKIFISFSSHSTLKPQVRRALVGGFAEKHYCKNFYPWSPQAGADERGFRDATLSMALFACVGIGMLWVYLRGTQSALQGAVDDTLLVAWLIYFKPQVFAKWLIYIARRRERMSAVIVTSFPPDK